MTFFVTVGRRWPAEETFKARKDTLGWDQCQAHAWHALPTHRPGRPGAAAARSDPNHLCGDITLPDAPGSSRDDGRHGEDDISGTDLRIPLGDAPVPARGGQPCPARIGTIKLTIAETARIERLAR